jgi:hypothetical protein
MMEKLQIFEAKKDEIIGLEVFEFPQTFDNYDLNQLIPFYARIEKWESENDIMRNFASFKKGNIIILEFYFLSKIKYF